MSSVSHSVVNTINKNSLLKAAEKLKIEAKVNEKSNTISIGNASFKFEKDTDKVHVSYWDDVKSEKRKVHHLAQLSTFFTMKDRMAENNFKVVNELDDVVMAVEANQNINIEFEENEVTVGV